MKQLACVIGLLASILTLPVCGSVNAKETHAQQAKSAPAAQAAPKQNAASPDAKAPQNAPAQSAGAKDSASPAPAVPSPAPDLPPTAAASLDPAQYDAALDKLAAALKPITTAIAQHDQNDAQLEALRQQLDPIASAVAELAGRLTPALNAAKARLDELGPAPKAEGEAQPESPEVTAERAKQQKLYNDIDERLKRARLLAVEADQMASHITAQRRALFTRSLFMRAASIVNPALWLSVWQEMPADLSSLGTTFASFIDTINNRLDGHKLAVFAGTLALILVLFAALSFLARRVLKRDPSTPAPSRFHKVLGAWWVALAIAAPPVAAVFLIALLLQAFDISDVPIGPLIEACGGAVIRIAAATGILVGLFAPQRPNWRLPQLSDTVADAVVRAGIGLACIVSATRIFAALNDISGAALPVSVAMRGLTALLAALLAGVELWRLGGVAPSGEATGAELARGRNWFDLLRITAWTVTVAIAISVLAGYAALGSFLADQLFWDGMLACLLFMAIVLVDEACLAGFQSATRFGQLMTSIGFNRKSLDLAGILVSGIARLTLFFLAAAFALAPWGLQSSDVVGDFGTAFFGFKVGEITLSPSSAVIAIAIFALSLAAIQGVLRWIDVKLLPQTSLDIGLRVSIIKTLSYVGFIAATILALSYIGVNFEKLAIVAGALSVGIGFGLQSIVNNFVSGLVLLWERAVRVGDWIVVGSDQGYVRRINVRSTEIETFDRSQVIIPNANLITGVVTNLVRNDRTGRLIIPITVSGAADPEKVREVLTQIAKSQELVLKIPAPQVLFTGMSASALNFELRVFLRDVETIFRVKSDLHFAIFRRFKEEKFFDTPGPDATKIEIAGFETLSGMLTPPKRDGAEIRAKRDGSG